MTQRQIQDRDADQKPKVEMIGHLFNGVTLSRLGHDARSRVAMRVCRRRRLVTIRRFNLAGRFQRPTRWCSSTSDLSDKRGSAFAFEFLEAYQILQCQCGARWEPVVQWSDSE